MCRSLRCAFYMPHLNQSLREVTGRITAPCQRLIRSQGPSARAKTEKCGLSELLIISNVFCIFKKALLTLFV